MRTPANACHALCSHGMSCCADGGGGADLVPHTLGLAPHPAWEAGRALQSRSSDTPAQTGQRIDSRCADSYVRVHLEHKSWGPLKIKAGLSARGVARVHIDRALAQFDEDKPPEQSAPTASRVERFDRRPIEPFELFTSEFGQNSVRIQENSSKIFRKFLKFEKFSTFSKVFSEIPRNFRQNRCKIR